MDTEGLNYGRERMSAREEEDTGMTMHWILHPWKSRKLALRPFLHTI